MTTPVRRSLSQQQLTPSALTSPLPCCAAWQLDAGEESKYRCLGALLSSPSCSAFARSPTSSPFNLLAAARPPPIAADLAVPCGSSPKEAAASSSVGERGSPVALFDGGHPCR